MQSTQPIIEYYQEQGKLCKVDANEDSPEVQKKSLSLLNG